jgi:hypothetical protein
MFPSDDKIILSMSCMEGPWLGDLRQIVGYCRVDRGEIKR